MKAPCETLERALQVLEEAVMWLDDYEWTGIDEWCVEGCGGCKHHGHNEGCLLVTHKEQVTAVIRDLKAACERLERVD